MYHTIEFQVDVPVALEVSPKQPLERILLRAGSRRRAEIKPYVVDTPEGPVEVADLFFDDGTATRAIPFRLFSFID